MPDPFGLSFGVEGLDDVLKFTTALPTQIFQGVSDALVDLGREFEAEYQERRLRTGGRPDPFPPFTSKMQVRSGTLRRSFSSFLEGRRSSNRLDALRLKIGFGVIPGTAAPVYAAVHEFGATIRPKRGTFLSIPMPDNLDNSGQAKIPSPRGLADPVFIPAFGAGGPSVYVFESDRLMFVLVRSVTIRPRLNFFRDVAKFLNANLVPAVESGLADHLEAF